QKYECFLHCRDTWEFLDMCEAISTTESNNANCLWSNLLDEVTNKTKVGLSDYKNLVIFGDELCGKSTLVSRLQGSEDTQEGFGLEYDIIEVKDEAKHATANLNVFVADGNPIQSHLLKYVITVDSFSDQMILIVVSINEPWQIIETLEKWADILNKHISKLKLSEDTMKACRRNISKEFFGYTEPEALSDEINRPLNLVSLHPIRATTSDANPNSTSLDESFIEKMQEDKVLNNNLGMPMIVVVTKTDLMKTMIKENQYTEEHFDYIQMHIRRFCLSYGAALFYVSVKEDKNCDLLNRYIQHRIYGLPFNHCAYVIEGDCIFIPAGWDNHKKINILGENLTKINAQQPFPTIIPKPLQRKTISKEPEISTIDEQTFLLRLSTIKENENIDPNMLKELLGSGGLNPTSKQTVSALKIPSSTKTMDDNGRLATSPTPLFRAKASPGSAPNNVPGNASNQGTSDGVLADFFSNLLKKRPAVTNTIGESFIEPQSQSKSTSDLKGNILNNMKTNQSLSTNIIKEIQETYTNNTNKNVTKQNQELRNEQKEKNVKQEGETKEAKNKKEYKSTKNEDGKEEQKHENKNCDNHIITQTDPISIQCNEDLTDKQRDLTDQSDTTPATGHLDTSSDNTNLTDLKHEMNDDSRTQDTESPVVPRHISPLLDTTSDIRTSSTSGDTMTENHSNNNDNLHEVGHSDHSDKSKPPTEFTDEVREGEDGRNFDTLSPACLTMTHSDQITDQPCIVDLTYRQRDLTDQSDTTPATGHLDTSSDNTNLTDLKHEMNDDSRTQDTESPVVPRHISPLLDTTSDIRTSSTSGDTMTENHSNNNDNLHEVGHSDHSDKSKPPTEFTDEVKEGEDGRNFDTLSPACLTMTHSDQITDQPCIVDLTDRQRDLTDQSDTTPATRHLDTSSDNTNLTDLKHEMSDDSRTQDTESPVVPRHISPLLDTTSDIRTSSTSGDTMTENHSNNNDNLHEVGHSDHSDKSKPPTEFTDEVREGEDGRNFDTLSPACLTMTHSDQITDQPCIVDLTYRQRDLTDQSDTTPATGHLDTSSDNTNLTDLKHEMNDDSRTQDTESPVVPRHISPLLDTTSDIRTSSTSGDTMTENHSNNNDNLH
ncbi:hypothetical protein MN116_000401, partial [Schistosoma mekongi]